MSYSQGAARGLAWLEHHLWVVRGKAGKISKVMKRPVNHDKYLGFCHRLMWIVLGA